MTFGFGWTSVPLRTVEVPEPDTEPITVPERVQPDETESPEPIPVEVP